MLKFTPIKLMAAIFTPEFAFGDNLFLINLFNELSEGKFNGEFISVPIPQDAPAEIPRIILNSKDGLWKLEVSLMRTALIFLKPSLDLVTDNDAIEFNTFAKKVFYNYKKKTKIRVQRLAYVTERVTKISGNSPAQYIADKFCKDNYLKAPFNGTQSFELHSLKKYKFERFDLNSWVRLKSTNLLDKNRTPVLLVVNDINTLALQEAPDNTFSLKDIQRFYNKIPDHLDSILKLYLLE